MCLELLKKPILTLKGSNEALLNVKQYLMKSNGKNIWKKSSLKCPTIQYRVLRHIYNIE